jgi:hypothetical protein|eukprot:COSAG02_NODE_463_length_21833_cov_11.529539_7_plen_49_part_00
MVLPHGQSAGTAYSWNGSGPSSALAPHARKKNPAECVHRSNQVHTEIN